ncbi:hypothetical protein NBRC116493_17010 [Aurantivibrio infirmus]
MHINKKIFSAARGVTLIELIVFITVVSIGLTALVAAINNHVTSSVDPIVQIRALECAQAKLDEVTARKFDEATPTSGIPACGSAELGATACNGISADAGFDDIGDFNGQVDTSFANCTITVTVVEAGSDLGIPNNQARRITVDVSSSISGRASLSTYRTNF